MVATTPQQQQGATTVMGATKTSAEEEALKRNTDCVYFLASPLTCKKGSECEYRHSEYARVNPRDCYYWLNGNCLNPKCGFRHPPLDGLMGTQATSPTGSSKSSLHTAATTALSSHMPYSQGASYGTSKQPVPCIFFQKGLCIKGDRCAFLHGPTTNNKAMQPAATTTLSESHSLKKTFGAVEAPQPRKFPPFNVSNTVGIASENKTAAKVKAAFTRSGTGNEKHVPHTIDEVLPRHRATKTTSVVNGGSMVHSNRMHQARASDEPRFHGKDTDEFLRESSPGFDVLVDDELRDSDFYHVEGQYGGTRRLEGRNVNEYDIGRSANFDATADVDQEMFHDQCGYDSFDHVQGNYDWNQQRASSERKPLGSSTFERRGTSRVDTPDHVEESDLRHRLAKCRRVNGLKSVVNHDQALENYEGERPYRGSSHERSLSSRLHGRIKLPGRSVGHGPDLPSEREMERGKNWGRHSPGNPQTPSQGRLHDRIKGRLEGEFNNNEGRNFSGPRIRREVMDERSSEFAGPKSLAELKVGKNTDNKEHQSLGKRKSIVDRQQTEGDLSFKGPMPLSEILKRKRQSEGVASGNGIASINKEDVKQKQSKGSLISISNNKEASVTLKGANKEEESSPTTADIGITKVTHGESSQPLNTSEVEAEDGIIGDESIEDHEYEADDQREGENYYEQVDEGEYNYEEGENVDAEEEYIEEDEDGDDFEKKLGVMFS
ncbi:zinc finger CCCH domain-containing protein 17-like [Hibiscus syriacus]|uniref:zinc finger CCCH domain-containing protein 17-like n=1 Tax=Hibiscus syriacus TaxID=106335 RepID=UPI001923F71C|nr:zinc finger CCCH domain-containing protein 17-like [Hibiscus syriacus]